MKAFPAAVLLLVAFQLAAASPCIKFLGNSDMIGQSCDSNSAKAYADQTENRAGDITKLNLYFDGNCVTGVKPTYGFKSGGAKLMGKQGGEEKDIKLTNKDHIKSIDIKVGGSCIEYMKFTSYNGAEVAIGKYSDGYTTLSPPVDGAFIWAFRGYAAGSLCQLQAVWATVDCSTAVAAVPKPVDVPNPVPVPTPVEVKVEKIVEVTKEVPTPVPVPTPVEVKVTKEVPTPTPVPVPTPVDVPNPVPVPTPVEVKVEKIVEKIKEVPTPVPVPTPVEVKVEKVVEVPTPVPVPTPVEVKVEKVVEVPTPVPVPTPVEVKKVVEVPTPVPVPTPVEKIVEVKKEVEVPVPVPVPTPVEVKKIVEVPTPVPVPTPVTVVQAGCAEGSSMVMYTSSASSMCVLSASGASSGTVYTSLMGKMVMGTQSCYVTECAAAPAPAAVTVTRTVTTTSAPAPAKASHWGGFPFFGKGRKLANAGLPTASCFYVCATYTTTTTTYTKAGKGL